MKFSTISILIGLVMSAPQIYGLAKPTAFAASMRKFPRSLAWGYALVALGTGWFLWHLRQESIADFAAFKPYLMAGFVAVGVATCIYLQDFLAVRGLAIVFMLLAKHVVDAARWVDTPWRLVLVTLAYFWVVAGIWFTISPWRCRDLIVWFTATEQRVRVGCALRLALAVLLVVLGVLVF
jgi:hypothetical protein